MAIMISFSHFNQNPDLEKIRVVIWLHNHMLPHIQIQYYVVHRHTCGHKVSVVINTMFST